MTTPTGKPRTPAKNVARVAKASQELPSGAGVIASEDLPPAPVVADHTENGEHDVADPGAREAAAEAADAVTLADPATPTPANEAEAPAETPGPAVQALIATMDQLRGPIPEGAKDGGGDVIVRVTARGWDRMTPAGRVVAVRGDLLALPHDMAERSLALGSVEGTDY